MVKRANELSQAGIITFSCSIIKGGVEKFSMKQPMFLVSTSQDYCTLLILSLAVPSGPLVLCEACLRGHQC